MTKRVNEGDYSSMPRRKRQALEARKYHIKFMLTARMRDTEAFPVWVPDLVDVPATDEGYAMYTEHVGKYQQEAYDGMVKNKRIIESLESEDKGFSGDFIHVGAVFRDQNGRVYTGYADGELQEAGLFGMDSSVYV